VTAAADFAAASETLAAALLASANDPADAIRLLMPLCDYQPPRLPGAGPLSQAMRRAQEALAAKLRCDACAALARAVVLYQPSSYQDAQSLRLSVCGALEVEAIRNADAGNDATYQALRDLRTAVALDLALRGAYLATLVEVETLVPQPSLVQAWALYHDTTREPELVASAAPRHPLWLPLTFPALSQ
jgi:prophage DNA circulation protein